MKAKYIVGLTATPGRKEDTIRFYAHLERDERIVGTGDGLRDIVRKANALIAIMA